MRTVSSRERGEMKREEKKRSDFNANFFFFPFFISIVELKKKKAEIPGILTETKTKGDNNKDTTKFNIINRVFPSRSTFVPLQRKPSR